jgi:ADP-heptose:LPS heptosyltransferase
MKYLTKIKNLLNYLIYLLIDIFLPAPDKINSNTLLIIRLDAIGDYLLFRNFLTAIKSSKKYKNHKITLCGNIIWKDLSEKFDKDSVDEFIWIDRKKFYKDIRYKFNLLKKIREKGFETAVTATHSREILYDDLIVNASQARVRIGSEGSGEKHAAWKRKLLTDKLYTTLIKIPDNVLFEFEINKELFSSILGEKLSITKPALDTTILHKPEKIKNKFVLLFPGASHQNKRWTSSNFKEIANFILNNFPYDIALSGSKNELYLFDEIIPANSGSRFLNFVGNTLVELAKLIAEAELLISNETSAVHFAAAVNTPFICISDGSHFGRFHPYPKEVFDKAYYIYPPEIMNNPGNLDLLKMKYRFNSGLDINEIKPQIVKEIIKKILG